MHRCSCLTALFVLAACGTDSVERAPLASDRCGSEPCTRPANGGVKGVTPDTPDTPVQDAGADFTGEEIEGEIIVLTSPDLEQSRAFANATVDVVVQAANGRESTVMTSTDSWQLTVPGPAPFWIKLVQASGTADLLGGMLTVEELASDLVVPMIDRQVMTDITDNLVVNPTQPDPQRGHAFLFFRREGAPLAGVNVAVSQGIVAYDVGALYSDVLIQTEGRGAAVLLNLPAGPFPGAASSAQVVFDGEATLVTFDVARDSVTIVTVEL